MAGCRQPTWGQSGCLPRFVCSTLSMFLLTKQLFISVTARLSDHMDISCGGLAHRHGRIAGPVCIAGVNAEGQMLPVILLQALCIGNRNQPHHAASWRTHRVARLQFHLLRRIQHDQAEGLAGVRPGGVGVGTALQGNDFFIGVGANGAGEDDAAVFCAVSLTFGAGRGNSFRLDLRIAADLRSLVLAGRRPLSI